MDGLANNVLCRGGHLCEIPTQEMEFMGSGGEGPSRSSPVSPAMKANIETVCPAEPQAPAEPQVLRWRLRELLSVQAELAKIQCAFTLAILQK